MRDDIKIHKERNGFIDLMRLVFAMFVMMYHFHASDSGHFIRGSYGVEFFVILSGFLFYAAWEKQKRNSSFEANGKRFIYWKNYMKKRYLRFFLYSFVAFIPVFLLVRVWHEGTHTLGELHNILSKDIWEILLVKMVNGFNRGKSLLNVPAWTLGPMLFVEFIILGMMVYFEKPFLTLLMPVSLIAGTGCWMNMETISANDWIGLFNFGVLRIYVLTCCGIYAYRMTQQLKYCRFTSLGRWCLTTLELLGYLWCIAAMLLWKSREYQFCFILVTTLTIAVTLSGNTNTTRWFPQTKLTDFCAEWSLATYLTHFTVRRCYLYTYPGIRDIMWQHKFESFAVALIISLIYLFIMRGIFWMLPRVQAKVKRLLIQES